MAHATFPQLSKSRFLAGLQCLKRLYLECHDRELADPIEASRQAIFDAGTAVGVLARQRFPGGALIDEDYFQHAQAVRSTRVRLSDASLPALFEPAFTFQGIRTRVDVLTRSDEQEFDLVEVKSTTGPKNEHIPDIAIQMHVVEGSGISIRKAYLLHINNTYVYQGRRPRSRAVVFPEGRYGRGQRVRGEGDARRLGAYVGVIAAGRNTRHRDGPALHDPLPVSFLRTLPSG